MLIGILFWEQLPAEIPVHWGVNNEPDGWASKPVTVFLMPLFLLGLHWICAVATAADPKHNNHQSKVLHLIFWFVPVLSVLVYVITYVTAMGKALRVEVIMPVVMGLLFAMIGNYMPKCKQNYTIGIKIPWTLNSEENWNKTHRFAGRLWFAGGIALTVTGFVGGFIAFFVIALTIAVVPIIYSYVLYRKGI